MDPQPFDSIHRPKLSAEERNKLNHFYDDLVKEPIKYISYNQKRSQYFIGLHSFVENALYSGYEDTTLLPEDENCGLVYSLLYSCIVLDQKLVLANSKHRFEEKYINWMRQLCEFVELRLKSKIQIQAATNLNQLLKQRTIIRKKIKSNLRECKIQFLLITRQNNRTEQDRKRQNCYIIGCTVCLL